MRKKKWISLISCDSSFFAYLVYTYISNLILLLSPVKETKENGKGFLGNKGIYFIFSVADFLCFYLILNLKSTNQKEIHVETLCKSMEPNVVPALRKQNSWPHLQPLYKQPQAQNQASKGKPSSPKTLPSLIYFSYFKGKKKREISIFIYPSISGKESESF